LIPPGSWCSKKKLPSTVHNSPSTGGGRGEALTIQDSVDLESTMAWKNGLFHFENADLKTVMRQLSRWYDLEVEYTGAVKNEPLFMEVPRNTNLSDVLKVIETTANLKLKIEGKKVTVL
jgi:ferric-dicitrate binding protein FerR (iron transport regulator)